MLADVITFLNLPLLVSVILVVLTLTLMVQSWMQQPKNIPPFPVWSLPVVGHLPFLQKRPRETMKEWRKKTGDIFSLYIGNRLAVVLNGYDIIRDTLVKQADIFSDRPYNLLNNLIKDGQKGIINASGLAWREQRSVSISILRDFGMGRNTLAEKIQEEVSFYLDELGKVKGQPQEVRTLTNAAVSNITCSIIVGKRFDYNDPYFIKFIRILNEQVRLAKSISFWLSFPWLRFLPGDFFGIKKILKNYEEMLIHFCHPFIRLYSKKLDDGEDGAISFITCYLKELKHKQSTGIPTTMEVGQLTKVIQHLFIAGSETTSTTIMWFMLYMLHYPDVQKKIFKEISDVVGTKRVVTLHDKSQLNYLNASIMESQRMASIIPFNIFHACTAEVNIRGYTIPSGTLVMPILDSILHDEKTWGDPMTFRPERFLDSEGNLLHPEEFVPYSVGKRICMAESLAKMELFIFLSTLLQRFELLPASLNSLPPLKNIFGITCPPQAYEIRYVERRKM